MMPTVGNSVVMTRVIDALFTVVGRRTLDSYAMKVIQTVLNKLEPTFPFLHHIVVHDEFFSQAGVKVIIEPPFERIQPYEMGKAIDALIQVVYMDLVRTEGDEVGLYFITELKGLLGDTILDALRDQGVHLERLQQSQHLQHHTREPEPTEPEVEEKHDEVASVYTWETVSSWKYDNNVCMLYDDVGNLLDTIQLDLLIEDYVRRVIETTDKEVKPTMQTILRVTQQDDEFLEMLKERDIDVEDALTLLHITQQKLHAMIQKLFQLDMLQSISDNEVKLTEKGLQYLHKKKTEETPKSFEGHIR